MIVIFGLHLDGERSWRKRDAFGRLELGPSGLLSQLEQYLGLSSPSAGKLHRLIRYRSVLQRLDIGRRFYSRSMSVDDFGVASAMLDWRDDLYLHGWDGSFHEKPVSGRLSDLAEIEGALAGEERFGPGNGERLMLVAQALKTLRTPIRSLRLLEPLDRHPRRWQEVIRQFPFSFDDQFCRPAGRAGSLLAALQQRLLFSGHESDVRAGADDDSVRVLTADTPLTAAYYAVALLSGDRQDSLLVHDGDAGFLDDLLGAEGFPRQAFFRASAARPALQLLPLALRLAGRPLDVSALLAFLTLPAGINPLHPGLCERIVRIVSRYPGIGGEGWHKTLDAFRLEAGDDAVHAVDTLLEWVDGETEDQRDGMSLQLLVARTRKVLSFFEGQITSVEDEALRQACSAGLEQAGDFLAALETLLDHGERALSIYQMEQLLRRAGEKSSRKALHVRQAGCVPDASHPAAVCEPSPDVFWWWMAAPSAEKSVAWSSIERAFLEREGVVFPSQEQKLLWQEEDWKRPVLAAERSLTLVLPPDCTERHPLWLAIASLFPTLSVRQIENPDVSGIPLRPLVQRTLARPRPFWSIPPVWFDAAQFFSPTSLEKLIADPCEWFLEYKARLMPSGVLDVSDGPRLYGLLLHRMVQKLCSGLLDGTVSRSTIDSWFDGSFATLVEHEGAVLLMAGRSGDLEAVRLRIRHALHHLLPVLETQGSGSIYAEQRLEGPFPGGTLYGYTDLLLTDQQGAPSVVDIKWGGATRRRRSLASGTHLQLLVYARLVFHATGRWPALAYYIASRGELLADCSGFFATGKAVRTENDEPASLLWQRVLASFEWRRRQLESGFLAVSGHGDGDDANDVPPPEALNPVAGSGPYNPFRYLEGWGECS